MNEMIERVARAIYSEYCRRMNSVPGWEGIQKAEWADLPESSRDDYRKTARVSVAAIRLPTLDMVLAGCRKALENGGNRELADEYTAMIDSLLE